jgi:hypothetical protein
MNEKQALAGLVMRAISDTNPPTMEATMVATVADWNFFLSRVFSGWASDFVAPTEPVIPARKVENPNRVIGKLTADVALTEQQKKRGITIQRPERRAAAPVYCGLTVNYEQEAVAFTWEDSTRAGVSHSIVQLNPGLTTESVQFSVMFDYDWRERKRIMNHNLAVAVSCAHSAIRKWARQGT